MAYEVIARKWRPQSFADLVGQDHVARTLVNALSHDRLPQALLFTGVRGTGKTSSARILAKSLRCPNAVGFVPCGTCGECQDIASSRSLDVIEIDGASNNGVDAIRELRDTIGYMPSSGKYKIYIIDEVHMLSTSAFNALLKTLEEPPRHVIFILATTEAQKIPNTILSRCQRFDFRRIPTRKIAAQLSQICSSEKIEFDEQAIWLLARNGDGSLRDSQSLLDQVITFCDGRLTLEKVVDVLGLTDRSLLLAALEALVRRDTQATVNVVEKISQSGLEAKVFAQDLLEEIRNALMVRLCPTDPSRLVDLPETEIQHLRTLTASLSEEDLQLLFDMTLKGVGDLLRSQDARLVLEMLLLRMAQAPRIENLLQMTAAQPTRATPNAAVSSAPADSAQSQGQAAPAYTAASFTRAAPGAPPLKPQSASHSAPHSAPPTGAPPPRAQSQDEDDSASGSGSASGRSAARANDPWSKFVEQVKKANSLLGAMLENTHLMSREGTRLTIGVPRKMGFLLDKVKDPENIKRIESFVEAIWKQTYSIEVKLADERSEVATTPKAASEQREQLQKRTEENAVEQNTLVRTAQNVFKAQIKSIKTIKSDSHSQ